MSNIDSIIEMREEDLHSRKGSIAKQDLIEAVCALKRRGSQDIALDAISDIIDKSLRERLDPILENLKEVTQQLSKLKSNVESLEYDVRACRQKQENLFSDVANEAVMRHQRRKSVVISGLELKQDGDLEAQKADDRTKVGKVLEHFQLSEDDAADIQRIGKAGSGKRQLLRVRFVCINDRQTVLRRSREIRSHFPDVFINPDRTPRQQEEFRKLRNELKARKESGEDVVIYKGSVVQRASTQSFPRRF